MPRLQAHTMCATYFVCRSVLSCVLTCYLCVSDTCYVLSFAIIMLNTSLHNPSVRDKPSVECFIKMNRGINEGGDLPQELLEVLEPTLCLCVWDSNLGIAKTLTGAWFRRLQSQEVPALCIIMKFQCKKVAA